MKTLANNPLNPARYRWVQTHRGLGTNGRAMQCYQAGRIVGFVFDQHDGWGWVVERTGDYGSRQSGHHTYLHEAQALVEKYHDDWMAKQAERVLEHEDF